MPIESGKSIKPILNVGWLWARGQLNSNFIDLEDYIGKLHIFVNKAWNSRTSDKGGYGTFTNLEQSMCRVKLQFGTVVDQGYTPRLVFGIIDLFHRDNFLELGEI